jgi:lipoprotein-anchoring transpeptidase ErfK/SrfK
MRIEIERPGTAASRPVHVAVRVVRRRLNLVVVVVVAALGVGGPSLAAENASDSVTIASCARGSTHILHSPRLSYAAIALRPLTARRTLGAHPRQRFETRNVNGVPMVFGVVLARLDRSCRATDYKVQLPIRPNGSTGWIRAADVRLVRVRTRIAVDLSQRRITLFRDGRPVLVMSTAIGAPSTPTPTGRFYVNQRLLTGNPIGDYGPGAVGISGFSPVLVHWPQGGPIAIHGTNAPDMVGFAVSHGCLRVRNVDIRKLLRVAAEGTPVEIRQ